MTLKMKTRPEEEAMDHITLWWIAIGAALTVTIVVAILLALVVGTARDIRDGYLTPDRAREVYGYDA